MFSLSQLSQWLNDRVKMLTGDGKITGYFTQEVFSFFVRLSTQSVIIAPVESRGHGQGCRSNEADG